MNAAGNRKAANLARAKEIAANWACLALRGAEECARRVEERRARTAAWRAENADIVRYVDACDPRDFKYGARYWMRDSVLSVQGGGMLSEEMTARVRAAIIAEFTV